MKIFKLIDCCIQVLLGIYSLIWFCTHQDDALLAYCFAVGGNLISCFIHLVLRFHQDKGSSRDNYQRCMLLILVIIAACYFVGCIGGGGLLICIFGLLAGIPVTVFLYIKLCIDETLLLFQTNRS